MTDHAFQTEVQQLLQIVIHSLYSEREIFLRELISNASDACDKLRFEALTDHNLTAGDDELKVSLALDEEAKTLTISDNGIGLTEAEAIANLGTIARSGTAEFVKQAGEAKGGDLKGLIGQFGVGFYASFMVADKVVVESRSAKASSDAGVRWESAGDGNFTTEVIARPQRGTTITLHLKDDAGEFAERFRVTSLIKRYSDYVTYPVLMPKEPEKDEEGNDKPTDGELEQVNAGQPLWTRSKDDVSDEQYSEFYKSACKQWDEPATRLHFNVEGTLQFSALLFIPSTQPFDFMDRKARGLSLYVRRVFIMDDCEDLLPEYLRFVRGVVDSDDLPLNVSRELLQQQAILGKLKKILVKRILDHLAKLAKSEDEAEQIAFDTVQKTFGAVLREGIGSDFEQREKLAALGRWQSTWTDSEAEAAEEKPVDPITTGFAAYKERMADGQDVIYYVTAPSIDTARTSPQLEGFKAKGLEVLYFAEPVDEWLVGAASFSEFDGTKLVHVAKGEAGLEEDEAKLEEAKTRFADLCSFAGERLAGIKEVRVTTRLTDSPCCLVADEHDMTGGMAEMMKAMGREMPPTERILELNPEHPLVAGIDTVRADSPEQATAHLATLRDQAILAEGGRIEDGADFAKRVQALLGSVLAPT